MRVLWMLLAFGPASIVVADDAVTTDPTAYLQQAIRTYQSAMDETNRDRRIELFARAETLFTQAISSQRRRAPDQSISPDLYLNQGNAALGAERLGVAVLAYRRALTVDPNHRRARQNLDFARTLLPDWVPTPEDDAISFGSIVDWTESIKPDHWLGIAAIVFLLTMTLAAFYLRTEKPVVRNLVVVFALVWIGIVAKSWTDQRDTEQRDAVVMRAEVTARSADSINAPPKFRQPVPAGLEVSITDDRDDWVRVRLSDGREAWLPASAIEPVSTSDRD
ncbi:SH3 domain-containing protein [Stieleria maiorica]|nr:SH3 domain-containing protein [Stieleria maiorica]